jgi:hypothetical protein
MSKSRKAPPRTTPAIVASGRVEFGREGDAITALKRGHINKPDLERHFFPEKYQRRLVREEAERARAAEQARLEVREEWERTHVPEQARLEVPDGQVKSPPGKVVPKQLNDRDREGARRAVADPDKYPQMSAREVAAYLGLSLSTVYEHPNLKRVKYKNTSKVVFDTRSVITLKNSSLE